MRVLCCCNGVAGLTVPLSVCTWWHWYSYNHFLIYCTWGNANILLQDALPTMGPMPLLLEECQIVNPTSFSLIVCTPSPLWLQLNCLSAKAWFFFFRWIVGSALCYLAAAQLCLVKNCSLQQCSLPCSLVFECRYALWPIFVCNQRTCFSGPSEQVLCNTAELCCSSVYKHHSSCLGKEAAVLTCTEARLQMLSCSEATRKKKLPNWNSIILSHKQPKCLEGFSFKATCSALIGKMIVFIIRMETAVCCLGDCFASHCAQGKKVVLSNQNS